MSEDGAPDTGSLLEPQLIVEPSSETELRNLDANYVPILDFERWSTVPAADDVWASYAAALSSARADALAEALFRVRETYFRIAAFDSGAIEGLYPTTRGITHTIAAKAALADETLQAAGENARDLFQSQLDGFEYVLDWATRAEPEITEAGIRELHATVCRAQRTYRVLTELGPQDVELPHSEYKHHANHVRTPNGGYHAYAPVTETAPEMARLVAQLRTPGFLDASPVRQAAYVHHAFTTIHPFADGNDRTARALASVYTVRAASIPLVIYADQREAYFDALLNADNGDLASLVDFVLDRCVDTMGAFTDELETARLESVPSGPRLDALTSTHGRLTVEQLSAVVQRIQAKLISSMAARIRDEAFSEPIGASVHQDIRPPEQALAGLPYHSLGDLGGIEAHISTSRPDHIRVNACPIVGVADDPAARFILIVVDILRPATRPLELRIADLYPALSASAEERIDLWARKIVAVMLSEFEQNVRVAIERMPVRPDPI